ncbi:MAG: restriction endonuclease subunit S [Methylococcales bacterium]
MALPEFINHLLQSDYYRNYFATSARGFTRINLKQEYINNAPVALAPLPEQTAIAAFLDRKTAQIDQVVAIKEKQIALLKERKQILIQNAVTRCLDPNVPMKDSGVEWLGEIPPHWKIKRLKYVVKILKRIVGHEGPDILSITQKGIKVKDIKSGEGQLAMNYSKYQLLYQGEFAMNHMDLLTGYVDISKFDGVVSPDYRVFVNVYDEMSDRYLLSLFQVGYKHKIFYRYGQGVSLLGRWRFPAENFNNFFVPIPPKDEQAKIVKFIETESEKIDKAIDLQGKQIDKIKEYKATLINSAVTGKIEVI